jgi:hypothetical protein
VVRAEESEVEHLKWAQIVLLGNLLLEDAAGFVEGIIFAKPFVDKVEDLAAFIWVELEKLVF